MAADRTSFARSADGRTQLDKNAAIGEQDDQEVFVHAEKGVN